MSLSGNGEVAVSDGALSRDTSADAADPFCLSHELPLLPEGVCCPFTGGVVCPVDGFLAGTGRLEKEVGGSSRRPAEDAGELVTSWPGELE
jgi:hypothetical protein